MSIDDILFSPIQEWRRQCREIATYILNNGESLKPMRKIYDLHRLRPHGALSLERLLELYHLYGQRVFYYVIGYRSSAPSSYELIFDGTLNFGKYEDGQCPRLGGFSGNRSIRDLNLVPNTYSRHYVFETQEEAHYYMSNLT